MERNCEYFMNLIYSVIKNENSLDSISKIINPNYIDKNGNGIYHYFSEYSLEKFYKINYNQYKNEIIKKEKYKEIIKEYKNQIPFYIEILDELKCDFNLLNKENNSPLIYSVINKNYYITKEYIKKLNNMKLISDEILYKIFIMCLNSGNCLREDCIQLMVYTLFIAKENYISFYEKKYLNNKYEDNRIPFFIFIAKDFNINIIEKFNSIITINTSTYYEYYYDSTNIMDRQYFLLKIKQDSLDDLSIFIKNKFIPLISTLVFWESLGYPGSNENYSDYFNILFKYINCYPFLNSRISIESFNTNINYQDNFGNTTLMYVLINKEKTIKIDENKYYDRFFLFIKDKNLKIQLTNNDGISAFGISLMYGHLIESMMIYAFKDYIMYRPQFNFEILIFIINYINDTKNYKKITNFLINPIDKKLDKIKHIIDSFSYDFNNFNTINGRTIFHYINIFSNKDNNKIYIYKEIISELIKLPLDLYKKDIFKRNALFYLFINDNEKIKDVDPYLQLNLCLEIYKYKNLNDIDIYGNSLIFYAVQAKAYKSIKLLEKNKVYLDIKNKEGNTIYSIAAILGDFKLFEYLYQINNNNNIFIQKVYSSKQIELFKEKEKSNVESIIDLYKKLNVPITNKIIIESKEKYLNNKQNSNIIIPKSKYESNYISLYNDKIINLLNNNNKELRYESKEDEYKFNINKKDFMEIKKNFFKELNKLTNEIKEINKEKSIILGDSLFYYCKYKNYEDICNFIIKNNYHFISICNDLLLLKEEDELNYYIHQISYENDLLNYKNEENITIFHILSKIQNDLSFYSDNNLNKYDISNIYDNLGNTPIYYACYKLNINFIETFTNYSFSSNNNDSKNVKYSLFLETKNKTSPLKSLYVQLNKKEIKILKLIIDISINTKKVYILHVLLFLIKNYKSSYKNFFNSSYKDNINDNDYLRKIIGLYLFYTEELKGSFSNDKFQDINPIFYCFNFKNFDFLFDILLKQKNIEINSRNKEGKNLIHLIVEMKDEKKINNLKKEDILIKALEYGFDCKAKDYSGKAPIYYAILNKENNIKTILLKKYNKNYASFSEENNKS